MSEISSGRNKDSVIYSRLQARESDQPVSMSTLHEKRNAERYSPPGAAREVLLGVFGSMLAGPDRRRCIAYYLSP